MLYYYIYHKARLKIKHLVSIGITMHSHWLLRSRFPIGNSGEELGLGCYFLLY